MRFKVTVCHATAPGTESSPHIVAWATGPAVAPSHPCDALPIAARKGTAVVLDVPGVTGAHTRLFLAVFTHVQSDYKEAVLQPAGSAFVDLAALPKATELHVQGQLVTSDGDEAPVSSKPGLFSRGPAHVALEGDDSDGDGDADDVLGAADPGGVLAHMLQAGKWRDGERDVHSAELAEKGGPAPLARILNAVVFPSWNAAGVTIPGAAAVLFRSVAREGGIMSRAAREAAVHITCARYGVPMPADPTSPVAAEMAAAAVTLLATFCPYYGDFVIDPRTGEPSAADRFEPVTDIMCGDCEDLASATAAVAADWGAAADDVAGKVLANYVPCVVSCVVGAPRAPGAGDDSEDGLCSHATCVLFARDALVPAPGAALPPAYRGRGPVAASLPRMLHAEATNVMAPLPSPDARGYGGCPTVRRYRPSAAGVMDLIQAAFPEDAPRPATLHAPYVSPDGAPVDQPSFFRTYVRAVVVPPTSAGPVDVRAACGSRGDDLVVEWDLLSAPGSATYGIPAEALPRMQAVGLQPSTLMDAEEANALAVNIRLGQAPRLQAASPGEWKPAQGMAPLVPSPHDVSHDDMELAASEATARLRAAATAGPGGPTTTVWVLNAFVLKAHPGVVDAWEAIVRDHGMPGGVACETHVLARGMVQWVVKFDTE